VVWTWATAARPATNTAAGDPASKTSHVGTDTWPVACSTDTDAASTEQLAASTRPKTAAATEKSDERSRITAALRWSSSPQRGEAPTGPDRERRRGQDRSRPRGR